MLVRWKARPVPARRINLDGDDPITGKGGWHHVHDLPGRVSSAAQGNGDIFRRNDPGVQVGCRRHSTFGKFAIASCNDSRLRSGRKVDRVGQAVENVCSLSNLSWAITEVDGANTA